MADPVTPGDDPLWYKDAIIYQLHVKSFFDANDDGIGDFKGLISKLDYIAELGATAVWLLPFYPSPRRDDGYDISLYEGVSPDYGTMDEARRFIAEAHARGMRVITELVINHTSDQHPWFQAARRAPKGSPERNLYVWADDDKGYPGVPIVFCDVEASNWTYDAVAGQYYWHRFYAHQPDLNFDNPEVIERVLSIMAFWLDMGVDGLRLDAVPYLVEREGTDCANLPETHAVLRRIRAYLDEHYTGRMLLAEANLWPEDTQQYFGAEGDECHMAFHFPLMPRMYMAIAKEDRFPVTDILRQTPAIPQICQWAIFLRNHDELTLETVTDEERDYLWNTYAADRRARINLGIRRRLAPLLERDRRRIELMNALLLTLPGTPVIYYGDEIGMGDNIHLGDRDGVRTPMQWTNDRNGGFSRADPERLVLPAIQGPLYGFGAVNVEAQARDPNSLLNWTRRMLAMRRRHAAFGRGTCRLLMPGNRRILAFLREDEGESLLCVANLAHTVEAVELDLAEFEHRVPVDLVGGSTFPAVGRDPYRLTLPPYGFYAFALSADAAEPDWYVAPPEALAEFATVVVKGGLMEALSERNRVVIEREALPVYLARRRWFRAGTAHGAPRFSFIMRLPGTQREVALAEIEVPEGDAPSRYLMPLCIAWEDERPPAIAAQLALSRVRQGRRVGYLTDGAAIGSLPYGVVRALRQRAPVPLPDGGTLDFHCAAALDTMEVPREASVVVADAEEPGASTIATDTVVVKLFRHTVFGRTVEAEMVRCLTMRGFEATPPWLGEVVRTDAEGREATAALVCGFVGDQGDAAGWITGQLRRLLDEAAADPEHGRRHFDDGLSGMIPFLRAVGRRLAEMHLALALPFDDPAFAPEEAGDAEVGAWARRVCDILAAAFDAVAERAAAFQEPFAAKLDVLRMPTLAQASSLIGSVRGTPVQRIHGRFSLRTVRVAGADAVITGFGSPLVSIGIHRTKTSPWQDVASILASIERLAARLEVAPVAAPANGGLTRELIDQFRRRAEWAVLGAYLHASPLWAVDRVLLDVLLAEAVAGDVIRALADGAPEAPPLVAALKRLAKRLSPLHGEGA